MTYGIVVIFITLKSSTLVKLQKSDKVLQIKICNIEEDYTRGKRHIPSLETGKEPVS